MLTHVLDTSAWVAHIKDEAGGDEVTTLFNDSETQIGISTLSLVEVYGILKAIGRESEFGDIVEQYRSLFAQIILVDEKVAFRATELRQKTTSRLPGIDAVIAATAAHHGAVLVHRDKHFLAVPDDLLKQKMLYEE
jgi:predicted nucleic acid-binding protein